MFTSSCACSKKKSSKNKNSNTLPVSSSNCSLEELNNRIAVRFFVKRSKRFDFLKQQLEEKMQQTRIAPKKEQIPECLLYLGLASNRVKTCDTNVRKEESRVDFQFRKPKIYECDYCTKIFFHKLVHRRHMIRHMNSIYFCRKCNRGFLSKLSKKKHDIFCRR